MMMEINRLPAEMLLEVHRRMTPSNLKNAVLVDKLWRDVGQDPALWEWCKVAVYTKEDIANLSIKRLKNIQEILISSNKWDDDDWEAFFRAVEKFSSLKKIDGLDQVRDGLNTVERGLLARSLAKLEDVSVEDWDYDHIEALFTQMLISTRVKGFHLISHADDLSQMEPELFARVLSRLENLELNVSCVTKDQMHVFFTEILNIGSLKRLELRDEDMWRHLKPGFFASVLSTIEEVSLTSWGDDGIDSDYMEALFNELSGGIRMKRLFLEGIDLSEIQAALLANALSGLEELRLIYRSATDSDIEPTHISTDQIQSLFTQISLQTKMKKLALLGRIDLRQLDPELFAGVLVRLEDVDLAGSDITTAQMIQLFTEMSRNCHLKSLNIYYIKLSPVDPEVFAKAVARLEAFTMHEVITSDQAVALFSEMSQNTVMKKIDLHVYDIDLSSVEPEVLASALIRLEEVRLWGIEITHDQARAFFTEMSRNSHLKKLHLGGDYFSVDRVDPDVLAAAVTNVKEVDLCGCDLSADQIASIFTHVLEGENKLRKLILGCDTADVNPEIMRKVEEKLKGQLVYPLF